jgi:hypothetical protein
MKRSRGQRVRLPRPTIARLEPGVILILNAPVQLQELPA